VWSKGVVWVVGKDITKVIRSLQCSAVNRCRERLDAAALKARELIGKGENDAEKDTVHDKPEYGVTSVLKRRHGL
jgi:CBS-domain-containing membrane protein